MSYSDFTLQTIVKEFQLVLNERIDLFAQVAEIGINDYLSLTLMVEGAYATLPA